MTDYSDLTPAGKRICRAIADFHGEEHDTYARHAPLADHLAAAFAPSTVVVSVSVPDEGLRVETYTADDVDVENGVLLVENGNETVAMHAVGHWAFAEVRSQVTSEEKV